MTRRAPIVILIALVIAACGAQQRHDTLKLAATSLKAASAAFDTYDAAYLADLVKASVSSEEKREQLRQYELRREPVIKAFALAYDAFSLAVVLDGDESVQNKAIAAAMAAKQAWDTFRSGRSP